MSLPAPMPDELPRPLIIACGALARELKLLKRASGAAFADIVYLPAELHNRPERIPGAVRQAILKAGTRPTSIFCAYGDCGTGGRLDEVLAEFRAERLPGPHCYSFFAGEDAFERLMEEEIGSFFLTDYLARHFERLVWTGLGLDRHPSLRDSYFAHYKRVVHLVQVKDEACAGMAKAAAARLNLPLVTVETGLLPFAEHVQTDSRRRLNG